jgi:tetratricopeptide (TPR) repeat protein
MALLSTYVVCLASGLVPLVNAELYLAALSAAHAGSPLLLALAGTLGQMSSKSLVYLAGGGLLRLPFRGGRPFEWPERVQRALRGGPAMVFVSALTGLPPFYVVSGAAGALAVGLSRQGARRGFARFLLWGSLGRFIRFSAVCLIPAMASAGTLAEARAGEAPPERDALVRRALGELHEERFDEALASAERLRSLWPRHPAGSLMAANVHQTMMRDYRRRDREALFEAAIAEGERLAEDLVRERPDAEAHFARGTARAYRSLHLSRRGSWLPALRGALRAVGDMKTAHKLDPGFVDPLLALGLHDYWKAVKVPLGLLGGSRRRAIERLQVVWSGGRYLSVEAAYALQTMHYREGDHASALRANDWLYARFPRNPVCLYHRALVLEALGRGPEALAAWDRLVEHLTANGSASQGFLAECRLHRAELLARSGARAAARQALEAAAGHAARRSAALELEGPLEDFDAVQGRIRQRLRGAVTATADRGR